MIFPGRAAVKPANCLGMNVGEIDSADRDFSRFAALPVTNPLVG